MPQKTASSKKRSSGASSRLNENSKPRGHVQDFAAAAECLKTLAHPVRLRIVQMLLHGRFTVGELAADCEIADNVGSEHLRLLQRCGFLISEREGRRVYYQIAEPHLEKLMACIEGRFLVNSEK
ncbi:MAG: metalloregulator ArsR/SmtB family transcription factor [Rubripirellula sp.]